MLVVDSSKPEVTYVTSVLQTPCKLIGKVRNAQIT